MQAELKLLNTLQDQANLLCSLEYGLLYPLCDYSCNPKVCSLEISVRNNKTRETLVRGITYCEDYISGVVQLELVRYHSSGVYAFRIYSPAIATGLVEIKNDEYNINQLILIYLHCCAVKFPNSTSRLTREFARKTKTSFAPQQWTTFEALLYLILYRRLGQQQLPNKKSIRIASEGWRIHWIDGSVLNVKGYGKEADYLFVIRRALSDQFFCQPHNSAGCMNINDVCANCLIHHFVKIGICRDVAVLIVSYLDD